VIAGRYQGDAAGRVVVASEGGARPPALEARVTVVSRGGASAAAVWARTHLRDLEDRYASAGPGADLDTMAANIVAVSLRHRVLCRFTAFVAVDDAGHLVAGEPHTIVQPVELPRGLSSGAVAAPMRPMARPRASTAGPDHVDAFGSAWPPVGRARSGSGSGTEQGQKFARPLHAPRTADRCRGLHRTLPGTVDRARGVDGRQRVSRKAGRGRRGSGAGG
jgi:Ca-activated chloride channel family protein